MARPLRRDIAGGWYHVTSRGEHRGTLFDDRRDHEHFLELLEAMRERFRVEVLAFVLMGNHYHLLVSTPDANLSRAIQWLNISYSVWFNKRHHNCGHVFQGRFKAIVVEQQAWGVLLSQYVHLNPVRIEMLGLGKRDRGADKLGVGTVPTPQQIERRLTSLRTYAWSSYRAYAGYEAPPAWLSMESLLKRSGGRSAYRRGVEDLVRQGAAESPWQRVKWGLVLGSESFSQQVREGLTGGREKGAKRALRVRQTFESVVDIVERQTGEKWESFCDRHGDKRRDLVLWLARRCTGLTLAELGRKAGGMDYGAVAMALRRLDHACAHDKRLAKLKATVERTCCLPSRIVPGRQNLETS